MTTALIILALTASPIAAQATDGIVEWCEEQWRAESGKVSERTPEQLSELLKRWQTYAPKCAGSVAYEARLAMVHLLRGDAARARETVAALASVRSPYGYLVQYAVALCDFYALTHAGFGFAGTEEEADRVEQEFQRVVHGHPDLWEAWAVLGGLQTIRGRHAQAIESLKRGLRSPASVTGVYRNLTISYAALGRYGDALDAADEAYARDKSITSDPYLMCALATANAAAGRLEDAELELRTILARKPDFGSDPAFKKAAEFLQARLDAKKRDAPK